MIKELMTENSERVSPNANLAVLCDCEVIHEDVVARVRERMPEGDVFYTLANFYKMLADKTRVRILWALSCESMCVCDLAVLLGMTKSAISHQLKSLRLANLVKYDKRGREVYYSLTDKHVEELFKNAFDHIEEEELEEASCHTSIQQTTTAVQAADVQEKSKIKIKVNSYGGSQVQ